MFSGTRVDSEDEAELFKGPSEPSQSDASTPVTNGHYVSSSVCKMYPKDFELQGKW